MPPSPPVATWSRSSKRTSEPMAREFSRFSLRFADDSAEAGFLLRIRPALIWRCTVVSLCGATVTFSSLAVSTIFGRWQERSTFYSYEAWQHHQPALYSGGFLLLAFLLFAGVLQCPRVVRRIGSMHIELIMMCIVLLGMIAVVLSSPPKVCNLQRMSFSETHGPGSYASDSGVVLTIDGMITAIHLGLPVRWIMLLLVEMGAVLLYAAIVFWVGSSEPLTGAAINLVFLLGLVAAAAIGKRSWEIDERSAFRDIIVEKSLRCRAEFELSNAHDGSGGGTLKSKDRPEGDTQSRMSPITVTSGAIFNRTDWADGNMCEMLAQVKEIGVAEHWCVNESEVNILKRDVLGSGHFGQIVKGVFCSMMVAVKLPSSGSMASVSSRIPDLCNELRIFRYLRHPNIVAFHGAIINPALCQMALVLELVKGVTLSTFLKCQDGQAEVKDLLRYEIMVGVCRALAYMHTRRPHLVHGDIKSSNIMIEVFSEGLVNPKLLDFGLSRVLTRGAQQLGGSAAWAAPELFIKGTEPKCSADVFSFGKLIAVIATSTPPLPPKKNMHNPSRLPYIPHLPSWPETCTFKPSCQGLVQDCLLFEETERPSMALVLQRLIEVPRQVGLRDPWGDFLQDINQLAPNEAAGAELNGNDRVALEPRQPEIAPDISPGGAGHEPHRQVLSEKMEL
uniref:Protein kinase domain-containing protein n=1 Tax=Alexandrium andersonii TaxID=327968 RepID=A0A7S2AIQ2_9DINO|mmetsp:Transcript_12884/g.29225  ORF Transcript_12884/g.29225 Transcript_12884/m.29225 type:complete len:675 (+) Transcript_12884:75-2099(+)